MIIDQWILTLMVLCGSMRISVQLFPELVISQPSAEGAVVVRGESTDTRFTGRTDYVTWSLQLAQANSIAGMQCRSAHLPKMLISLRHQEQQHKHCQEFRGYPGDSGEN